MRYKLILFIFFCWSCFAVFAQSKNVVRRADAFFVERTPGNIRLADDQNEVPLKPDTLCTVYVELSAPVKWISAWKDGRKYSIAAIRLNDKRVEVGVNKSSRKKIILTPAFASDFWMLQLSREGVGKPPLKPARGELILQGTSGKKTVIQRIKSQIELEPIPSV